MVCFDLTLPFCFIYGIESIGYAGSRLSVWRLTLLRNILSSDLRSDLFPFLVSLSECAERRVVLLKSELTLWIAQLR